MRNRVEAAFKNPAIRLIAVALLTSTAAGCSSDVTRFDNVFSSSDGLTTASIGQNRINAVNGQLPTPSADVASARQVPPDLSDPLSQPMPGTLGTNNRYGSGMPMASNSRTMSDGTIQRSNLSAPFPAPPARAKVASLQRPRQAHSGMMTPDPMATGTVKYNVIPQEPPRNEMASLGTSVPVVPGRVPVPTLPPVHRESAILPATPQITKKKSQSAKVDSALSVGAEYKVAAGDSLSAISRKTGISIAALKEANGLSDSNIRIGQVLKIPGSASSGSVQVASVKAGRADNIKTSSVPAHKAANTSEPKPYKPPVASAKESISSAAKTQVASVTPAETGINKYRWPVTGAVIAGFGANVDGRRNDGIDISVPEGTPIKAAENGLVIYAGDGLEKLGNTVLIRHQDGKVTVYAHAKKLDVSRGDSVKRGQVIASSGMTGDAKRPNLHFEVRKNSSPVNPMKFLE